MNVEVDGIDFAIEKLKKLPWSIRIAASKAANDTMVEAQTFTTQKLLPSKFTLRGRGRKWFEKGQKLGFNIQFSKPETLEARLGSQADFLALQEHGGQKTGNGHRVAIPSPEYKPKPDIMRRDMKPRAILGGKNERQLKFEAVHAQSQLVSAIGELQAHRNVRLATKADKLRRHELKLRVQAARKASRIADKELKKQQGRVSDVGSKAFVATMSNGFVGIFKRLSAARSPLKLLFSLTQYAHIRPGLDFEKDSGLLANERYDANFAKRFREAMQ